MMDEDVSCYFRFDTNDSSTLRVVSETVEGVPVKKLAIFAKTSILIVFFLFSCMIALAGNAQSPGMLYEMVPHVVLPQTIQYKPMPTSLFQPGTYTAYTNYPATYTAFPSYILPYPAEMRSIQQAVYPVIQQPAPLDTIVFPDTEQQSAPNTVVIFVQSNGPIEPIAVQPEVRTEKPVPALPRTIQKKIPFQEIDVYAEEEESGILQMNYLSSIESFLSKRKGTYSLVQWSNPAAPANSYPAFNPGPFANASLAANPYPPAMGTAAPYATPYGFAVNTGVNPPYATPYPYPQATLPQAAQAVNGYNPAVNNPTATPGLSQDVLNQIEQLLQNNPNMQFSAVMMGPNGQIIPLNSTGFSPQGRQSAQQPLQQAAADPAQQASQQMQQLQTQMQYIQAMNQYVQQLNAARTATVCPYTGRPLGHAGHPGHAQFGGYAPYIQPMPGNTGGYALANPYYLAMYQAFYGQQQPANYGVNPYAAYGYGPMFNPYLPPPQGYYGTMPSQGEKSFFERFRERRRNSEQQMCAAWRASHYPEETGMRMPAKNAYPWGYFGAQAGSQETPNFGGHYGMYFGSSTYPGM